MPKTEKKKADKKPAVKKRGFYVPSENKSIEAESLSELQNILTKGNK